MEKRKKPLIAVFGSRTDEGRMQGIRINYMKAIKSSGGIPLLAPIIPSKEMYAAIAESCDGFLFAGGVDLAPSLYGEEKLTKCGEIDALRDECELCALEEIVKTRKAVLGICRGIQTIAVARGGTLWQDLPSQRGSEISHAQKEPPTHPTHTVKADNGTLLFKILGQREIAVNSFHHQAVKSTNLSVSATAPDGVIEAIEDPSLPFFLGVQWHPEYTIDDGVSERIFRAFCEAAK